MLEPIQREGVWWHRQADGSWLRFDVASAQWAPSSAPPPPPPPPPPAATPQPSGVREKQLTMPEISRPMMMAGVLGLAIALVVTAALVFMGGGEEPIDPAAAAVASVPPPPELSKRKQFIHDADQICADLMTKFGRLPIPTTLDEVVAGMEQVRAIVMDARSAGAALEIPKDARKGWTRMMGTDKDIAEFDAVIAALKLGDISVFQTWEQKNKGSAARDRKWAKHYGMAVCSQKLS